MLGTAIVKDGLAILMHVVKAMHIPIMLCAVGVLAAMGEGAINRSWFHKWQQKRHVLSTCCRSCLL